MQDLRLTRGEYIAKNRRIFKVRGEEAWLVESETTKGKFYKVRSPGICECFDQSYRMSVCKHIRAVVAKYHSYKVVITKEMT